MGRVGTPLAQMGAMIHGRCFVSLDDIKIVAHPVLRHRIMATFNAEASGLTSDDIVQTLLAETGTPASQAVAGPPPVPR